MSHLAQNEIQSDQRSGRPESTASHRRRPLRVLFVHRDADAIESCLQELKKAQFTVSADFVLTLAQCTEHLRFQSYDVVVAEYPNPNWKGSQALQLLHQAVQEIPLLFVTTAMGSESIGQLTAHGTLRHSQSLYRALTDNPAYGVYRCNAEGELLDVNQALLTMLGYESKEQLLAGNHTPGIIPSLANGPPIGTCSPEKKQMEPVEQEWKRKDGTTLKVRLSGRGVHDDYGNFAGHEIIAVDVTEQRTLEDQLRLQASTDSLTGLANHRCLFEVLHAEICRSQRTGREFSLVLLDLDGLKKTNDQFGHLTGDRALCRLGQILRDCCRAIDTAARHGGDEFALVLPETSMTAATLVAHRICDLLAKDNEEPMLSVSVGVASYPKDADTIGTLLYAADRALYGMKEKRARAAGAGQGS